MRVHPGRIIGVIVGLAILATLLLVPFSGSQSLYGTVQPFLQNISAVSGMGSAAQVTYDYILMVCFLILAIAGIVGFFPLGSGVLGIVGMAILTAGAYFTLGANQPSYDTGFYLLWVESVVVLIASFVHRRGRQKVDMQSAQSQAPATPAQPSA